MTTSLILKAALIWFGIVCLAVLNGFVRENLIAPNFGMGVALPLSGILLSGAVFLVTYVSSGFIGARKPLSCILVGTQWVVMTLAFDFLLGYIVAGKSWWELLQIFNIASGNLFALVLVVTFLSPWLVARIKNVF